MKHLKTYEFFDFFKKKKTNDIQLDIDLIRDLLESDLDGVKFRGIEITTIIKFENCRCKKSGDKPKLTHDKDWLGEEISYSHTGHYNGVDGILVNYDIGSLESHFNSLNQARRPNQTGVYKLDTREIFFLSKKILDLINKDRMQEFGIGYCINKHHYIGDGIVFYKL